MPGEDRKLAWARNLLRGRAHWLALSIALIAYSATFSALAPAGSWPNRIHGSAAWVESDPGSIYVASAHELSWGESPLFLGHPGATLTPLLLGVQSGLHALAGEPGQSFARFTAQQLPLVFFVSKAMMTLLHLLSFAALYALAKRLLADRLAAAIGVLAYASSFPVLYYVSRISVEPLMVLFFALSYLAVWRSQELAAGGRPGAAAAFAAAAGVTAISGVVTKLNFLAPLPIVLTGHLVAGGFLRGIAQEVDIRARALSLLAFLAAAGLSLALYSQTIDWEIFAEFWQGVAERSKIRWTLADFAPALDADHIIIPAEGPFLAIALVGWALFLRRAQDRDRAFWFSGYALYALLLFGYRVAYEGSFLPFHYFLLAQAALAPFFGWAAVGAGRRLALPTRGAAGGVALLAGLALLHGLGAWTAAESRLQDAGAYDKRRPAFRVLEGLRPGERIGAVAPEGGRAELEKRIHTLHGMVFPLPWDPRPSVLRQEFLGLFETVPSATIEAAPERVWVPVLRSEIAVLGAEGARADAPR